MPSFTVYDGIIKGVIFSLKLQYVIPKPNRLYSMIKNTILLLSIFFWGISTAQKLVAQQTNKFIAKGDSFLKIYENTKAIEFYKRGIRQENTPENQYKLALAYDNMVDKENREAIVILKKLTVSKLTDSLLRTKIYTELGNRYRVNYQYDSAEVYLNKALPLANKYNYLTTLHWLSRLAINKGDFDKALQLALDGLKRAETANDPNLLAYFNWDLGIIHKSIDKYSTKALSYLETVLKIGKKNRDAYIESLANEALSNYFSNIASEKNDAKLHKKALGYMQAAFQNSKEMKDSVDMAYFTMSLANFYIELNDLTTAKQKYEEVGKFLLKTDSPSILAEYYYNYGDFLFTTNMNKPLGLDYLGKAALIWEKAGLKHYQSLAIQGMALGYEQMGNYKKALELQKEYHEINSSLAGENTKKQMQELTVKYETEKKDKVLAQQKEQLLYKDRQRKTYLVYFLSVLLVALLAISLLLYRHVLVNKKALAALKIAEEQTLRAKEAETFSHTLSHDLRHPILQVRNTLDLLLKRANFDDETTKQLKKAHSTLQQTDSMVKRLLALFMLEEEEPFLSEVDTNELMEEVVEEVKLLGYEHIQFDIASLPLIHTDRALLKQIFTNLLSNAVKYSSKEPNPLVKVTAETKGASQSIIIQDNGIGISAAFYTKLFLPFMRYNSTGDFDSVGLGLVIVKRITEKLHGYVSVRPQEKGFCIEVSLPA